MPDQVCVDWDGTLVDTQSQQWLPGAQAFLHGLLARGYRVVVHTCRANWPEGLASVEAKLEDARLRPPHVTVAGKPAAVAYVDNLAVRFEGDYQPILREIQPTRQALRNAGLAA